MAGEDRTAAHALEFARALESEPYRFDFYLAIRRLECLHPDKPRVGQSLRPVDDPIRLAQEPSLAFAPASLASFKPGADGRPSRLAVYFQGLLGPNGPLPLHLTEYARDRMRNSGDLTFVRFLDVFHHRLLSLFYRAWSSAQPTVSFDRPEADRFALYVGALFGLGMPSLRGRDALSDLAKLHYAGALCCPTRHAAGLEATLADFFRMPVAIEEFVGQWLELPADRLSRLGTGPEVSSLGESVTVGSRTWECHRKFRITLGPLPFADYESLLPGRDGFRRLIALVRNYAGMELAWDVRLILERDEVLPMRLGGTGQLGWTTWLAGSPLDRDPDDLVLDPEAEAA